VTLSAYAKDFFLWGKCIWLTKRTEESAIISNKIASQHRAHLVNYILPQFGSLLLRNIKPRMFEDWRRTLKLSNATRNHIRNTFKLVMERALYDELVQTNLIAITRPLSEQVYEQRDVFTPDEIKKLFPLTVPELTKIWGTYQFAFLVLASTGMRSGEARALTWSQIHLQERSIDVDRAIKCDGAIGPTKSEKNRVVLLPETVVTHLACWQQQSSPSRNGDFVFPGRKIGCPLSKEWIIERSYRGLKNAGINQNGKRNLVPHSFRHTFISQLSHELPPEVINLLSGHSTDQMRLRHTHTTSAELLKRLTPYRDALDKLLGKLSSQLALD
jgi:integrase